MTAAEFDARLTALGYLSVPVRAGVLGVSQRTAQGYQEGRPIPRMVGKLVAALEENRDVKTRNRYLERRAL